MPYIEQNVVTAVHFEVLCSRLECVNGSCTIIASILNSSIFCEKVLTDTWF
jgi:hypothetical protein